MRVISTAVLLAMGLLLSLSVNVVFARWLPLSEFGIYSFCIALTSILAIFAQVGLPQLVIRETAKLQLREDWVLLRGLWRWSAKLVVKASLVIVICVLAINALLSQLWHSQYTEAVFLALMLVPFLALTGLHAAMLKGVRKVIFGQASEVLVRPSLVLGLFLMFATSPAFPRTAMGALSLNLFGAAASFLCAFILVRRFQRHSMASGDGAKIDKHWYRSIPPLAAAALVATVNSNVDILMLGAFRPAGEVGLYKVAATGGGLVVFVLQALNIFMAPRLSRIYHAQDLSRVREAVTQTTTLAFLAGLPLVILYISAGESVVETLFGSEYRAAYPVLIILSLAQLMSTFFGPVGTLLNMTGYERLALRGLLVSSLANVILNILLIPLWGTIGAALASGASIIIWNVALWWFALKRLGVDTCVWKLARVGESQ